MDERQALIVFGALSQETRLRILRMLVVAGPDGIAAGTIAEKADVSASNVSFHLKELERSGLATARRDARSIIYSAAYETLSGLIRFLMEDCCAGHVEVCAPVVTATACCALPQNIAQEATPLALAAIDGSNPEFRAALIKAKLPVDDLEEAGRRFFSLSRGGSTVAFGGYELHGEDALLRSIVVLPEHKGRGVGETATGILLERARLDGARHAYLLTTTAAPFFEKLGFRKIDRTSLPETILATRQATALCPQTATVLEKKLAA